MNGLLPGERVFATADEFHIGDEAVYLKTQRGGYGFQLQLPAKVVGFTRTGRVRIRVASVRGTRAVLASNLRRKESQ